MAPNFKFLLSVTLKTRLIWTKSRPKGLRLTRKSHGQPPYIRLGHPPRTYLSIYLAGPMLQPAEPMLHLGWANTTYIQLSQCYIRLGLYYIWIGQCYIQPGQYYIRLNQCYIQLGKESRQVGCHVTHPAKKLTRWSVRSRTWGVLHVFKNKCVNEP